MTDHTGISQYVSPLLHGHGSLSFQTKSDTSQWNNEPPSRLMTMDDVINIGWAGPPTTMREMMSTTSGPLCYFYK